MTDNETIRIDCSDTVSALKQINKVINEKDSLLVDFERAVIMLDANMKLMEQHHRAGRMTVEEYRQFEQEHGKHKAVSQVEINTLSGDLAELRKIKKELKKRC